VHAWARACAPEVLGHALEGARDGLVLLHVQRGNELTDLGVCGARGRSSSVCVCVGGVGGWGGGGSVCCVRTCVWGRACVACAQMRGVRHARVRAQRTQRGGGGGGGAARAHDPSARHALADTAAARSAHPTARPLPGACGTRPAAP
jgi:hypothetical protein